MKRILNSFTYLFIFSIIIISCGKVSPKGEIQSKDIELSEFSKLDLKGKFRVFYVQSPHNFVNVETYPNFFDNLNIEVKDKNLSITEKRETDKVDFYNITIYGKNPFDVIKIADSVELNISSQMKVENFALHLKDNAKFIGSVISEKSEIEMTNKSRSNLLGKTTLAKLNIKDTASIISPYWYIKDLEIESQNGNYAELSVDEEIKGKIGNTSKLIYYGNPSKKLKVTEKATLENKKLN
ncbi:GIN domain-containing protein [Epilithonimonas hominis]|uniref:Putative auto-transporter adhesin, head GIN domain n=1 Tax=Epilithonimonas hominis TaxID=420404 RepID=A0A1H6J7B1_9FLAO|nr:Putative auto-transporter adhesin, head GIN domain [Epilithonimonas hominis]